MRSDKPYRERCRIAKIVYGHILLNEAHQFDSLVLCGDYLVYNGCLILFEECERRYNEITT